MDRNRRPENKNDQSESIIMNSPIFPNDQQLGAAKILIVDDEDADIRALEWTLQQAGFSNFRSLTASTQAQEEFKQFQPDLVVLDLHMPELDGFGVLKQLREAAPAEEFLPVLEQAWNAPELRIEGVMTHFAEADAVTSAYTTEQLGRFHTLLNEIASRLPDRRPRQTFIAHAANSAALLTRPESRLQMVRAGLALYGLLPSPSCRGVIDLEPAMTWTTRVAHLRRLPAGRSLGYGRTFTTKRPSLIGLLPIGYAAGYARLLSNQAACLHQGDRVPVVGRISMDLTMIDLTDHPSAEIGDEVVLLGRQGRGRVTAEELAGWAQTIPYEIVCNAGSRTLRRYIEPRPDQTGRGG